MFKLIANIIFIRTLLVARKAWKFLSKLRYIEISFSDPEKDSKDLYKDLRAKKNALLTQNYLRLMRERLIPLVRENEMVISGLLLTDAQCWVIAHQWFLDARRNGHINEFNIPTKEFEVMR